MNIQEQFNKISQNYDNNRRIFISCFDDFYKTTTDFITENMLCPKRIIDLGAGTGLLTYYWFKKFPQSEYVLVDIADEMLNVARERFEGLGNVTYEIEDYVQKLPESDCDVMISALSIHHLNDEEKQLLFTKIYDKLPDGGIFVNYDQFCAGSSLMDEWFDDYWIGHLENSELSKQDIELWRQRRKLDQECSVEVEMDMMKKCNFKEVKCVYSFQKFSVIVAIK